MIVVNRDAAELLYAEREPEKSSTELEHRIEQKSLSTVAPSFSVVTEPKRAHLRGRNLRTFFEDHFASAAWTGIIITGLVALGGFSLNSAVSSQRELASEGPASIMASATGASIDRDSEGLPGSTEISGSFGDESVQLPLEDPTTGRTLKTVEAMGAEGYSYTVKGTLDDYSISFKKNGSEADGKSYRYDSKTEKVREVTEKDLW